MTVLDTSFLIEVERGTTAAVKLVEELDAQTDILRIPAAAWVEYLATFAPTPRSHAVRRLESSSTLEAFTRDLADEAARLQYELMREGRPLRWHDLQIAATAIRLRETLVTTDIAFHEVPGLDVRRP